jgi:GNAT superfamily N-acetyltransferase
VYYVNYCGAQELSAIYLRRNRQRTGTGRRLVAAVVNAQRDHGADY